MGVISNGSAVLGLGNIGALASKPVMEGKGVLFKRFADLDVFDIEIDTSDPDAQRAKAAVSMARERTPELMIDGEMQADTAVVGEILAREYPFSRLDGPANVLIFPELAAANVAYKLLSRLGGVSKPFNVLHRDTDMESVVHVIAITVAQTQELEG